LGAEDYFKLETKKKVSKDQITSSKIKVYPNPATDYLRFENPNKEEMQLRIYSVDGKEIENIFDVEGNIELDVLDYKLAVYLCKFEDSDGVKSGKVVKK